MASSLLIPGVLGTALVLTTWFIRSVTSNSSANGQLPPGPKGLPLLGSALDIPPLRAWFRFTEWAGKYGELVYAEALGNSILILNSIEAVNDLLEKRATSYSDRPGFVMVGEMMQLNKSLPMQNYVSEFKAQRKLCHMALHSDAIKKYVPIQESATAVFVETLLERPEDFAAEIRLAAGRIVLGATYGISVEGHDNPFIEEAERTMEMIGKATVPGAFLVDLLPSLRHIPYWFPFNSIHSTAAAGRKLIYNMVTRPLEHVKAAIRNGTARPSFVAECLEKYNVELGEGTSVQEAEEMVRWAAGAMYGAGGETTYTTILNVICALALFPSVQAKLRAELDSVIGPDRLPTLEDRKSLPYLNATIKEVLRWRPTLPLGIAHQARQEDDYKGYRIPKGTIIIPNVWNISIDKRSGIPPSDFAPERHIPSEVPQVAIDPYSYAFGFGRRVCPGKYLGDNNLFLIISWMVSAVTIHQKRDEKGVPVPIAPEYSAGLVSYPGPFEVEFKSRSEQAVVMIKQKVALTA